MEQEKVKEKGFKHFISIVGRVAFIVAIMFLISYLVTILTESKTFFRDASARTALVQFDEKVDKVNELAQVHYDNLYAVADDLQNATTEEQAREKLKSCDGKDEFGSLRYYRDGQGYDVNGAPVVEETYGGEEIAALVAGHSQGCTAIYYDALRKFDCIAFFVPVRGSAYADGLLSVLKVHVWAEGSTEENIPLIDTRELLSEEGKELAAVVIDKSGIVYGSSKKEVLTQSIGNDFRKFIRKLTVDSAAELDMQKAINAKEKTACHLESPQGDYVLTVTPIEAFDGHLYLVTMTEREGLIAPEMKYIRYIVNLTIISIISLTIGMIYAFFYYKSSKQALQEASFTDPTVGCANAEAFRVQADKLLQDRQRNYAVAVFEIRQFQYLEETLSADDLAEVLKFVAKVMDTFTNPRETFGYLSEGRFALLMLYDGEKSVRDRARLIDSVLGKNTTLAASRQKKLFNIGVSLAKDNRRITAAELINHANGAAHSAKNNVNLPYVIYNEQINAERANNDRIEREMETALVNKEFRLFLQPKYNVAEDRIDSAEALVRWFDPAKGDYRFPGEFISLFESNGFITKLDHYMYVEVLKYLQAATERGEKQVPISVNVSLVTANQSDFLNFYIENKKKYGVADDYIIIEFTESFLMEDHQKLHDIVERLHRNGIRCSLDDFGTGYASFSLLKDVSFDELKLDRALLETGFDQKQDEIVTGTIIQLAKSLGMRVVQEGVETKTVFEKVVAAGCDCVQGYYYAKAIPVEEYKLFLGSNTSIKYKSLVK